ncbi:cbb3-type cytochrome c oxidase subunit 3 [Ohtaekwangia sp.]|uniref:cbb3-type cytochrome c oxidase subunit 3 n=1 Tax=Ohtaekwangia sp. TaxID=2066019 RepID=UPI002F9202B2
MYKNILQNMDNIAVWPVISFVIFFLFFLCLLWWVFTTDRKIIDKLKHLPMEEGQSNLSTTKPE